MIYLFVASIVGITSMVFYKTIITKEWRNLVPNESEHWHGVFFYHNRDDPRYLLPKRTGLGWTINFAHPGAFVLMVLILIAIFTFGVMVTEIR